MTAESIIQTFFGAGSVITAFAYAFSRRFATSEYSRFFIFLIFLLFVVMFLVSLR